MTHAPCDVSGDRNVTRYGDRLAAIRHDESGGFVGRRALDVHGNDTRAAARKQEGRGAPDSVAGPGNDDDTAIEPRFHGCHLKAYCVRDYCHK
jgi:hypothetical protein